MTQFWGVLFGINFAMGVATGVTMEFQFGTNWAYYAHYVGDVFGTPLAIEGLMAFFLEATFIGLFFFGWDRLGRVQHLIVTCAAGARHEPVGVVDPDRERVDAESGRRRIQFRHDAHGGHVVHRGDVQSGRAVEVRAHGQRRLCASARCSCLSISAWYLLRGRNIDLAKRSMTVAASFGLASALSVVVLGDESGYTVSENQKMKLAAIEAMWDTEPPPASFTVFGFPDVAERTTHFAIHIPWVMGIIGTRSLDGVLPGINELVEDARGASNAGASPTRRCRRLRREPGNAQARAAFDANKQDLGYALLLKREMADPAQASSADVQRAAASTIPNVPVLFWSFRIMVGCGMYFIALFAWSFWLASQAPARFQSLAI